MGDGRGTAAGEILVCLGAEEPSQPESGETGDGHINTWGPRENFKQGDDMV